VGGQVPGQPREGRGTAATAWRSSSASSAGAGMSTSAWSRHEARRPRSAASPRASGWLCVTQEAPLPCWPPMETMILRRVLTRRRIALAITGTAQIESIDYWHALADS